MAMVMMWCTLWMCPCTMVSPQVRGVDPLFGRKLHANNTYRQKPCVPPDFDSVRMCTEFGACESLRFSSWKAFRISESHESWWQSILLYRRLEPFPGTMHFTDNSNHQPLADHLAFLEHSRYQQCLQSTALPQCTEVSRQAMSKGSEAFLTREQ